MLDKTTRYIILYDFYQDLLTEKQKKYTELYFQDDLSLGEIADEFNLSRQGVYEHIKRTEILLDEYENKLQLVTKYENRKKILNEIEDLLNSSDKEQILKIKEKLTLLKRID